MSPKTTPSAAKLKPATPIAEAGLRFSGEILITRISMDHSIQPRDRAAGQRDELAALHGRRSSRWGPHNTTPLLKKAAVHRSKIEYRMAEMGHLRRMETRSTLTAAAKGWPSTIINTESSPDWWPIP